MANPVSEERTPFLWVEEGEQQHGTVAEVAPLIHTYKTYSFAVPEEMEAEVALGQRVAVPMGRRGRPVQGFVVGLDRRPWDSTLRPIDQPVDAASFLDRDLIALAREMAIHYACPLGLTVKALTPEAVRRESGLQTVRFARLSMEPEAIFESGRRISPQRRAVVEALAAAHRELEVDALLHATGASSSVLRGMAGEGWIEITGRKVLTHDADVAPPRALSEPDFALNDEQKTALEEVARRLDEGRFSVTLLHGVSGSGKTEVYIHAMRRVVAAGRQAILLVPEIVLTTQLVERLARRFDAVAVNHSGLTDAQRSIMWRQIQAGERPVVIGTRSAVFAPCPRLGLIVVDEEQETGYKNLQAPRFHVRDVAIMRARQLGIPVLLGSATPALESWHLSEHHRDWHRATIRHRVRSLPLPHVHVVDMRDECAELKRHVTLSRALQGKLRETLDRQEQALVLMNRRGFANRLFCPKCKANVTCVDCNVAMVVHAATGQCVCHYCGRRVATPKHCPSAGCGTPLERYGLGTQRIEDELAACLPGARIRRVDSDTMTHRDLYLELVEAFSNRQIDVLVGTQMIAKGLDFPFVSCVGMIDADPTAVSADFRAEERLFQLVTQVAGRAGRADAPGHVVVQTTMPDLPALTRAIEHDYEAFAREELAMRAQVKLPPYRRLARIVLADRRDNVARAEAETLAGRVREAVSALGVESADIAGPHPCVLARLRGRYRHEILIHTPNASAMRELLTRLTGTDALRGKVKSVIVDVDPVTLT